jgi:hypothetical protein
VGARARDVRPVGGKFRAGPGEGDGGAQRARGPEAGEHEAQGDHLTAAVRDGRAPDDDGGRRRRRCGPRERVEPGSDDVTQPRSEDGADSGRAETKTVIAVEEAVGNSSEDETKIQTIITRKKKVGRLLFLPVLGRVYGNNSAQKVSSRANKIDRIEETKEHSDASTQYEASELVTSSLTQTDPHPDRRDAYW